MVENTQNLGDMISGAVTKNRKRLMGFGIFSLIFGIIGMYMSVAMTMASILVLGVFMLIAGIVFFIETFSAPQWSGKLLSLLLSILYGVAGTIVIIYPGASAVWFTLFLAAFFIVIGIVRIVQGFQAKGELNGWGWLVFLGMIDIILGFMIYAQWPVSGLWVIGMFISIELIVQGINAIVLSREIKKTQKEIRQSS